MKAGTLSIVVTGITLLAASAHAGGGLSVRAEVDQLGGPVVMQPRDLGTIFGNPPTLFTDSSLSDFNTELQNTGITTDGKITFLFSQTDQGLSWVAIVDDENQPGNFQTADAILGLTSAGPSGADIFINDDDGDVLTRVDLGNGNTLASGTFEWDSAREGDGMAWTSLVEGDFVSFNFTNLSDNGLDQPDLFQFVSWNGQAWDIVATGDFSNDDQFGFSFTIIPAPGALAVLGLGLIPATRRRRRC